MTEIKRRGEGEEKKGVGNDPLISCGKTLQIYIKYKILILNDAIFSIYKNNIIYLLALNLHPLSKKYNYYY